MKKQKLEVIENNNNNIPISNKNINNHIIYAVPPVLEPESAAKPTIKLTKKLSNNAKSESIY